ncbi:hypothetical protein DL769_010889 [Monosporascus sp. CRB-8-3]|nr:hypothetical protein DL769_010889 [Monosporascus sp. CRB-8-3]
MRVSILSAALAFAAPAVLASGEPRADLTVTVPDGTCLVGIGEAFDITWSPPGDGSDKVTVSLAGGFSNETLIDCGAISSDINNVGIMQWDVKTSKPDGSAWTCPEAWFYMPDWAIKITTEDGAEHWSETFHMATRPSIPTPMDPFFCGSKAG